MSTVAAPPLSGAPGALDAAEPRRFHARMAAVWLRVTDWLLALAP